ncbi:hypothetical protein P691DRAFT_677105, partial [Macrolepiota fuliginosa MF-IS2]
EGESAIGEELGIIGCRRLGLCVMGYETPSLGRLYKWDGLVSVMSRILVVDVLQGDIPVNLIMGCGRFMLKSASMCIVLIVRLIREDSRDGFQAFTDQSERIAGGMPPLKNIMKDVQLRRVHLYPQSHRHINKPPERRRADVVGLSQPLSDSMFDIHNATIQ